MWNPFHREFDMVDLSVDEVYKWNAIIYPSNEKGEDIRHGLSASDWWDRFQIKSYPKFRNVCAYRCPATWIEDVTWMVEETRKRFGDKVEFNQIKEKFCILTVYFSADEDTKEKMYELIAETKARLVAKGVHP